MMSLRERIKKYFENTGSKVYEEGSFIIVENKNERKVISINPDIEDLIIDYGKAENVYYAFNYHGFLAMEEI